MVLLSLLLLLCLVLAGFFAWLAKRAGDGTGRFEGLLWLLTAIVAVVGLWLLYHAYYYSSDNPQDVKMVALFYIVAAAIWFLVVVLGLTHPHPHEGGGEGDGDRDD